jgi:hypothetical protein
LSPCFLQKDLQQKKSFAKGKYATHKLIGGKHEGENQTRFYGVPAFCPGFLQ